MNAFHVYILANRRNGTLYIGLTNNLLKRVHELKNNIVEGFTKKNNVHKLVYFEKHEDINIAIELEKKLKRWKRKWKLDLIESVNLEWRDLYNDLI